MIAGSMANTPGMKNGSDSIELHELMINPA